MQKLLLIIGAIALVVIAFFQYKKARRVNPPNRFVYELNEKVDANYFDSSLLVEYYEAAANVESYVRGMWFSRGVDATTPNEGNPESVNANRYFNGMLGAIRAMEQQLLYSTELKAKGFSNAEIRKVVEQGVNPDQLRSKPQPMPAVFKVGDQGPRVKEIQGFLVKMGFEIPVDGNYRQLTANAVSEFQRNHNIPVTGNTDEHTFDQLKQAASAVSP